MPVTAKKIPKKRHPSNRKASHSLKKAKSVAELAREFFKDVPPEEWDAIPRDRGKYVEHYLYGTPKK